MNDLIDKINKSFKPIQKAMEKTAKILLDVESNLPKMEQNLVNAGWTLNGHMELYHAREIGKLQNKKEVDKYFYNYYMENNQLQFNTLMNSTTHSLKQDLVKAYEECIFAFENKKYIICANTLIAIIEGIVSDYSKDSNSTDMKKAYKEKLDSYTGKSSIGKMKLNVNYEFILRLYSHSNFNSKEPVFINRHWLLHGRSNYNIKEIDCIRLFNAIGTLCIMK